MQNPILGFGCTKLTHNNNERLAISNLETAYDVGITYFDTARLYGFGRAETILGKFIKNKRDKVTVCSKVGLIPRELPAFLNLRMINIVRAGLNKLSTIKEKFVDATNGLSSEMVFSPQEAEESLNRSLKELQTDYVDYLLLHEYNFQTANRDEVIVFLQKMKTKGKIKSFGIGSDYRKLPQDLNKIDPAYKMIQFESNILNPVINSFSKNNNQLISIHSIFKDIMSMSSKLNASPKLLKTCNEILGVDLKDRQNLAAIFLEAAKKLNPDGVVLFTSKNNQSIKNNKSNWERNQFTDEQISLFQNAIQKKPVHFQKS